jgi:ATP-binding cassette, subfamily B, bacterial PglK
MPFLRKLAFLVLRTRREVRNAVLLLSLMLFAAALEAVGVGLIMPFVALIQNPRIVETSRPLQILQNLSGATTEIGVVCAFGIGLAVMFVAKNAYLSFVQWLQFRFIAGRQVGLARHLVERYLGNQYTFHLQHNSSELIQNVMLQVHLISNHVLVSVFTIAVEALTVLVVLCAMVAVEPLLVPVVGASISVIAFGLYRSVQQKSLKLGEHEKACQADMIRWLQQGLGGIKEAQVIGVERFFLDSFGRAAEGLGRAEAQHRWMMLLPRYVLESLGIVALVAISLGMLLRGRPPEAVLPVLGVLAIAAVRLLPSVSRILACLTDIRHNVPPVEAIYAVASAPERFRTLSDQSVEPLVFQQELSLLDVEYRYPGAARPSLRGVTLTIRRGESIAFVGGSGAGKTTIADVLIGLLEPTAGKIEVDGKPLDGDRLLGWRHSVGYIPQQVYLCDDSVLRNIAFGIEDSKIDRARVERAIDAARLREFIESMPEGLDTFVGERGVRISGGQRQRIGIARALYLEPQVLVLDEATSALDGKTEREIVEAIERIRSERTAIIIAHRLSTVRNCDRLVFMKDGSVVQVGSWNELYAENTDFRHLVRLAEAEGGSSPASASA